MTSIRPTAAGRRDPVEPLRPRDHAEAAAEAIRALNHATLRHGDADGYVWPADVDAVLAELHLLAGYLPQAFTQAAHWLAAQDDLGRVRHDTPGAEVATAVAWVLDGLADATVHARDLAMSLADTRRASSHLAGVDPDADPYAPQDSDPEPDDGVGAGGR